MEMALFVAPVGSENNFTFSVDDFSPVVSRDISNWCLDTDTMWMVVDESSSVEEAAPDTE